MNGQTDEQGVLFLRYGGALDAVISSHMVNVSSPDSKRLFHQFLSLTLSSGKYQVNAAPLWAWPASLSCHAAPAAQSINLS